MTTAEKLPPSLAVVPNIPWRDQTDEQLIAERDYWLRKFDDRSLGAGSAPTLVAFEYKRECEEELRRRDAAVAAR